ncbi:MAG: DoxX-like family protein [Planctomycetota bacterium]
MFDSKWTRGEQASVIARVGVAFVWIYHGLVPKLWLQHASEMELIRSAPVPVDPKSALAVAGFAEVLLGCWILVFWRSLQPIYFSIAAFLLLLAGAAATATDVLGAAFNPVSLSVAAVALCSIHILLRAEDGGAETAADAE